jgi:beta-N-acetylhexosaminidase
MFEEKREVEKEKLKREKEEIEKKIGARPEKKNPLELEKMKLEEKIRELEKILEPILIKEKEIEEKKLEIEKEEKETKTILEKRERERERWQIEEEREKIEKEKWFQLEKIEEFKKKRREIELKIKEILEEGEELKRKREEIIKKEGEIELKKEKEKLEKILKGVSIKREGLEEEKEKILNEKEQLERELSEILQKEKEIEEEEKAFEEEEKIIGIVEEKKEIESQRAEIEKERKEIEIKRWEIEDKKIELEKEIKKINGDYQKIFEKEKTLNRRIKEICEVLGLSFEEEIKKIEEKPEIKEEKPEIREEKPREEKPEIKEEKPEIREEKPREEKPEIKEEKPEIVKEEEKPEIEEAKEEKPEMEEVEKKVVIFPEEEKLEFLKREEIRTMEKDIRMFREIEAKKEGERVSTLETEKKKVKVMPPTEVKVPLKETVLPKPPKKSLPREKILVRIGAILIFLFLLAFFYWFFLGGKPPPLEKEPEVIEGPAEEVTEKPEIAVPPPLISVKELITPEISELEEVPGVFSQIIEEEFSEGDFFQIAIKNVAENRLVSLEELSQSFQVEFPEGFFQKLDKDYTLSVFTQKEGKRIVLITKVKEKEGFYDLLKSWEGKLQKEGVFLSGQKISTLSSYFRTAFYQNISFYYLTISKEDSGICYAWFDDYFVFTTSFQSIKKVIEEVQERELEEKIGQLFIVGFEGKSLTPQLEEFFKKYKPGGLLLLSKNIEDENQLKNLISDLQNLSRKETGLPLFIAVDQEGGQISRVGFLEEKTPQSEIETKEEAYQIGFKRGGELRALGINLNLAPLLDFSQEGDFLFLRSFQKSAENIGELTKSLISGQKEAGILTAIKHFPGYSGISFNPEEKLAILEKIPEISQFKAAMEVNPELVMVSNIVYQEVDASLPFTFSQAGIQFLKNNLGPEILIISDDLDQNSLLEKFSLKEIMTKPIGAGVDILIFSGYRLPVEQGLDTFSEAVKNKEISQTELDEKITKIIEFKQKLLK